MIIYKLQLCVGNFFLQTLNLDNKCGNKCKIIARKTCCCLIVKKSRLGDKLKLDTTQYTILKFIVKFNNLL